MITGRNIISPMAWGNGAYVVHRLLERHLKAYQVVGYHPRWTLFPFLLPAVASTKGADLIHTTPDYALFFSRGSIPLIISFQNYVLDPWMRSHSSWIQKIHYATDLRLWSMMAIRKTHFLTAVSQSTARLVRKNLKISHPVRVIYNGVDVDLFTPASSSTSGRKEVRVFFSGNLTRRKGAHWLPSIAKHLQKNIRIYYTQGLRTRKVLPAATALQPIGSVVFEDMPNRYRQMDILVMPTVREGFSIAVLEAMASGLPVVASDCSSLPEQIDNGKGGFLCPVGDVNAFAEKINLLADSPKLRREMGEYNRAKVEKMFTLDRMVKKYQELFESVLA
jgi:glycosyltransferase involved in cell wall biosynthesis